MRHYSIIKMQPNIGKYISEDIDYYFEDQDDPLNGTPGFKDVAIPNPIKEQAIKVKVEQELDQFDNEQEEYGESSVREKKKGKGRRTNAVYLKTTIFDEAIRKVLKSTPYACINDLKEDIKKRFGLDLAKQTLIRRIKFLQYSYQKFSLNKPVQNNDAICQARLKYAKVYSQIISEKAPIYFYNYMQIHMDEYKGSMWMKLGEDKTPLHFLTLNHMIHVVMIADRTSIKKVWINQGQYCKDDNPEEFQCKIKEWINEKRAKKQNQSCLAIERNLIHNISLKALKEQAKSYKIQVVPIPPDSSPLNPIENIFNRIKFNIRNYKPKNIQQLLQATRKVIELGVNSDLTDAFKGMDETLEKARMKNAF